MKNSIFKILAVLMSLIVLLSTISVTVEMHFCGDTLVDTSIFQKAENCGMDATSKANATDCSISKKNCCNDKQIVVEGQRELKPSFYDLSFAQQFFIASYIYSYEILFHGIDTKIINAANYSPPPLIRDVTILDEVFLI